MASGETQGGIGTHVGDETDSAFGADVYTFIRVAEPRPMVRFTLNPKVDAMHSCCNLLVVNGGAALLRRSFFFNRAHSPRGFIHCCENCIRLCLIGQARGTYSWNFSLLPIDADKARNKFRAVGLGSQKGVNGPILNVLESLDLDVRVLR